MVTIYFTSGKELTFPYDWRKLAPKFQLGGVRMFSPYPGVLIPLNSNTIERIEEQEDEELYEDVKADEPASVEEESGESEEVSKAFEATSDKPTEREPEEPTELTKENGPAITDDMSPDQKNEARLAWMKEMSECPHENHDIYYSASTVGRAKKPVKRYFPVCAKCGVREKFVKADTLTDEQKETAKLWVSKD